MAIIRPIASKPPRILVVEDESVVAYDLERHLKTMGYECCGLAASGEEALEMAERLGPDLVLMDIILTGKMDGIDVAEILGRKTDTPIVFTTAYSDEDKVERAKLTHSFGYVLKPFNARELRVTIEMALSMAESERRRRAAEAALGESEAQYRLVVENAECAIIIVQDGRIAFANQKFAELGGNSLLEPILPRAETVIRKAIRDNERLRETVKTGGDKWLEIKGVRIDWRGLPAALLFLSDVTYAQEIEEDLRRARDEMEGRVRRRTAALEKAYGELKAQINERRRVEDALAMAQSIAHIGTWDWDIESGRLYLSDEVYRIFGFEPGEVLPDPRIFLRRFHPDDRERRKQAFLEARNNGKTYELLPRLVLPGGEVKIVHEQAEILRDPDGSPGRMIGAIRDVTADKVAERELLEREEELNRQTKRLAEANIGLKVLIQHRENEKQAMREDILNTIKKLVEPFLCKLKKGPLTAQQEACLTIVESNLAEIVTPGVVRLSSGYLGLTPTEIEVANLVKAGKTGDEIAEFLHVSDNAIRFHRKNIRGKLGLKHKKVNLRVYLQQMT